MKTDKNSRTQSTPGTDTHPEQAIPDTNQRTKYEVTLFRTEYKYATVTVEATSLADAEAKAEEIVIREWALADADQYVASVELAGEGQAHE